MTIVPTEGSLTMADVVRIEGFAIVSEDGMLADADGVMPVSLQTPADQRFFEAGLDRADVVVHGRHSQEHQPKSAQRRRLIATHAVESLAPDPTNPHALLWNPAGAPLEAAVAKLGLAVASIGVIGATGVFGLFLDRYDAFFLTRGPRVRLPGGRPVFPGAPARSPEEILLAHGLQSVRSEVLDVLAGVRVAHWRRAR